MSDALATELPAAPAEPRPRLRDRLHPAALWATRRRAALLAGVVGVLVYLGSLRDGFAYDDVAIIAGDPRVRGLQLLEIFRLPYWRNQADLAIYRPLTTLSFAVDWLVSRGYPWFFHAINALEHGVVCALVFVLLAELFTVPAALLAALVFAVHPVHVEAVANVVGRAEVVSAIFYLLAILVWVRRDGDRRIGRLALLALLYAIALLHKESSATLPAALVLVDFALGSWRLQWPSLRGYLRRAWPMLATLAVVLAGYVVWRVHVLGRMTPDITDPTFDLPMPASARVMTALQAWPIYARLLFFPRILLADYSPRILLPTFEWTALGLAGLGILTLVLVAGADALRRGRGRTALALLWFPLAMLPVSNLLFPIGIVMAERTLYLPMLSLCVGVAAGTEWVIARRPRARRAFAVAAGVALVALAARTVARVPVWDSTNRVFYALEADRPDSFRAWWHLARVARSEKKPNLEMSRYERAMRLWPYRKGLVFESIGRAIENRRIAEARNLSSFGVSRWPREVTAQRYLASTSLDLGDTARARIALRAGLAIDPADSTLVGMAHAILPSALPRPGAGAAHPRRGSAGPPHPVATTAAGAGATPPRGRP